MSEDYKIFDTEILKTSKEACKVPSFIDLLDLFGSLLDKGYEPVDRIYHGTWEVPALPREEVSNGN